MTTEQPRLSGTVFGGAYSQFDILLAAIPLALAAGIGSALLLPVPLFVGTLVGATVAGCLVGYGIYAITQSTTTGPDRSFGGGTRRIE